MTVRRAKPLVGPLGAPLDGLDAPAAGQEAAPDDPPAATSAAPAVTGASRVLEVQLAVADVFGNIAEFWGFTRTQGRVFGLLFVSPRPLAHADIRDALEISAGSASMTLASLVEWGAVRRIDRWYVAETDFWRLITSVLQRRERAQVDDAIRRVEQAARALDPLPAGDPAVAFIRGRLHDLLSFFRLGRAFLDAFVIRNPIHGLLGTIARRAAKIPALLTGGEHHVRVGH